MSDWPALGGSEMIADPYPYYARMHAEAPVRFDAEALGVGVWNIASYASVSSLLRDPRLSADRSVAYRMFTPATDEGALLVDTVAGSLAFKDPPDHTRLRGLLGKVFTPAAIDPLRARVEMLVDDLLDRAVHGSKSGSTGARANGREGAATIDLIEALAAPLPVTVICDLLGVPVEDAPRLKPWIDDYALFFGSLRGLKRALVAARELHTYFRALFAQRRAQPRDDLLTALARVDEESGDSLNMDELAHTAIFVFVAGHHTTTNLIGNGMLALLRNPAALAALRADPSLVPTAIEELLRYDSPVQAVGRVAIEDVDVEGHRIAAGQLVYLSLAAANRDPTVFVDQARVDVTRANANKHLSFGFGAHYCIGAPLARLEGAVAFSALLRRFPSIQLVGAPHWNPNFALRGLQTLPLSLRESA